MQEKKMFQKNNKVLVVGGGVAGIRASLDIAESGGDVVLIDKAHSIGGLMTQLDRTFPTNNCDLCTISPNLSESGRNLHMELLTMTEFSDVKGEAGNFEATIISKPRYIDLEKCTACGECYKNFPEWVSFTPGLDHRAPTCMRYPQATPQAFSINIENNPNFDELETICKPKAIIRNDSEKTKTIQVGAIVLCPGASLFDPKILDNFGKGQYPDIVTSLEYERILSASGPTQGNLTRLSDGKPPKKIAWIQCVGSRSLQNNAESYCSSVCCMFALKEAMVTKERFHDDIETTIFYMDIRTFGKGYEEYLNRAINQYGVKLVRSRPHSIIRNDETGDLLISHSLFGEAGLKTSAFDMVVLATGFKLSGDTVELSKKMGLELNHHNFIKTLNFSPVATSKPGIFVCGIYESPKDIPETMVQASAAACSALLTIDKGLKLAKAPKTDEQPKDEFDDYVEDEFPMERDVTNEEPKIGVFICDCGLNIGNVIDVNKLSNYVSTIPNVATTKMVGHGCSRESLYIIKKTIESEKLNRIVIGGCSPRTHEKKFQDILQKSGINKYLLEIANLRDQDTWVHMNKPVEAFKKAKELMSMAIEGVKIAKPLKDHLLPINKDVLVVGGGVAGMTAALALANQGLKIYLVEISPELGGFAKNIRKSIEGEDIKSQVENLVQKTTNHENIQVLTRSIIVDHHGLPGLFTTGIQTGPRLQYRQISHGVTIIATGAMANRPQKYLLGEHKAVMNQLDLEKLIYDTPESVKSWQNVVMIQCVGSRDETNPNCSRICCQAAVKNALKLIETNPSVQVFMLYRDMRTFGFYEDYYREARNKGVIFIEYEKPEIPTVNEYGDKVEVTFKEQIIGRKISVVADSLILSTGFIANDEGNEDLSMIFKLPRTDDGYFLEEHIKLRPVDLPVPGFFVAGTAHAPKTVKESITQGLAAAGRALTMLSREHINLGAQIAKVDGKKCAACLICVRACPFGIPYINQEGYSEIDPSKCHGCGVCSAECPAKAIQLFQFEDDQIMAKLDGLFERMI
ncbi:MAG: CoB--CoM heterodisulfide reductase iron-sulfur subunit A family protein [Desulfobacterales bacterium]|nr:CoB--CoM heterodisulfide reductase iron-sulfur subunit A family protein [Desulfobacterales bacterium]